MTLNGLGYPSLLLSEIDGVASSGVALPSNPVDRALLLDVAFYAGLQREEGRDLSFALSFIAPELIESPGHTRFSALIFESPLEFTVHQVVKLAPALDCRLASIGVNEGPRGLQIWGLFRHGLREFEMLEGLEGGAQSLGVNYLRITCERPGRLDVDVGLSRIASFSSGTVERGVRLFVEEGPVYDLLVKAGRAQGDNSYLEAVQKIVWAIRAAQHGGTLLFLPDADMKCIRKGKYTVDPRSRAADDVRDRARDYQDASRKHSKLIQRLADAEDAGEKVVPHLCHQSRGAAQHLLFTNRTMRESVRFFAALANVDGALVLGPDLHVLTFGAMLERAEIADFQVHIAKNSAGEIDRIIDVSELGGARHQSAAHFCYGRPGALAVVISQDGGVSCFHNDGTVLRGWRSIRLDRRQPPETISA